jgi:oligopeptide transport system permease protein
MVSGGILCAIALVAVIGPWLSPNEYVSADFNNILRAPTFSAGHIFGTDELGRDSML